MGGAGMNRRHLRWPILERCTACICIEVHTPTQSLNSKPPLSNLHPASLRQPSSFAHVQRAITFELIWVPRVSPHLHLKYRSDHTAAWLQTFHRSSPRMWEIATLTVTTPLGFPTSRAGHGFSCPWLFSSGSYFLYFFGGKLKSFLKPPSGMLPREPSQGLPHSGGSMRAAGL